jgi:hypothetical protein
MVILIEDILINLEKLVVVVVYLMMMKKEIFEVKHFVFLLVVYSMKIKLLKRILTSILKNYASCYLPDGDTNRGDFDGDKKKNS